MVVFGILMTLFMGLFLSAIMTIRMHGLSSNFLSVWLSQFLTTWVIVIPTVIVVIPIVEFITKRVVQQN